ARRGPGGAETGPGTAVEPGVRGAAALPGGTGGGRGRPGRGAAAGGVPATALMGCAFGGSELLLMPGQGSCCLRFLAPQGPDILAQGNALGIWGGRQPFFFCLGCPEGAQQPARVGCALSGRKPKGTISPDPQGVALG